MITWLSRDCFKLLFFLGFRMSNYSISTELFLIFHPWFLNNKKSCTFSQTLSSEQIILFSHILLFTWRCCITRTCNSKRDLPHACWAISTSWIVHRKIWGNWYLEQKMAWSINYNYYSNATQIIHKDIFLIKKK